MMTQYDPIREPMSVIASLRLGAEEMLATQVPFEPDAAMTIVDVPVPSWLADAAAA